MKHIKNDPDIVEYFPDQDSVNDALRTLIALIRRRENAEQTAEHQ